MSMTGASAMATQFQAQVAACASWSSGSSAIHFPDIDWSSGIFPCGVISETRDSQYYAAGASGLRSGSFKFTIYTTGTVGAAEVLGQAIVEEMLQQQAGICFRSGSVGLCGVSTDALDAGQNGVTGVELDFEYGLQA